MNEGSADKPAYGLHPSHLPGVRSGLRVLGVLGLATVLVYLAADSIRGVVAPFHLPLHTLAEAASVLVAGLIFSVGWYAYRRGLPGNLLVLACGFLAVGLFDLAHALSYQGMPDFFTPNSVEKSIQLWLIARLIAVTTVLVAVLMPWRPWSATAPRRALLSSTLLLSVALIGYLLGTPEWIPRSFAEGQGLSGFKISAEYLIVCLSLTSAVVLWRRMRGPLPYNAADLFTAAGVTALSELIFTLYLSAFDVLNLLGHVFKVIAYFYLYRAIFVGTVRQPYDQLDEVRDRLSAIVGAVPDLLFEVDLEGRHHYVHAHRDDRLVVPADRLLGSRIDDVMPPAAAAICHQAMHEALQSGHSRGHRIELPLASGPAIFELSFSRKPDDRAGSPRFIVISRDITERARDEQALRLLRHAFDQSPSVILVTNAEAEIVYANPALTSVTGYRVDEVLGRNPRLLQSGKTAPVVYRLMWSQLARGQTWRGEFVNRRKDGSEYTESALVSPVLDAEGKVTHYLSIQNDVTQIRLAERRIDELAHFDALTGLPNRTLFNERVQQALAQAARSGQSLALLLIDLDHFKNINDTLGFGLGDELLLEMTQRMRRVIGEFSLLARHGSDEFLLLLPDTNSAQAAHIAGSLLEAVQPSLQLQGRELALTASIGIAVYPNDADNGELLLQHADAALHRAKQSGRARYTFFSAELQTRSARALQLDNALRQALARDEFSLVYQPQIRLDDRSLVGMEVLLRWQQPQLGAVSPAEFIPIAEASGQIVAIGEWVLRSAVRQLREWIEAGLTPPLVAVNLSIAQFRDRNLPNLLRILLAESELPAQSLELELTESVAMEDPAQAISLMHALHGQGIRLSIDDFGTGYSSLSYLKRFPAYKLKIDQSFVRNITADANDRSIVSAIIAMARSLGMQTIAEGVETPAQLDALRELGCQEMQGYLHSRPLTAQQMRDYLDQRARAQPPA